MENIKVPLVEHALKLAVVAHAGQVRKSDGSPYIVHPIMVARIVERAGFSETVVAAALLHDVLEDTALTEAKLREEVGDVVTDIVCAVSEDKSLPWEMRKEEYIARVAASDESVRAVSIADKIHNAESLLAAAAVMGANVWHVFNQGKEKKLWFEESLYTALSERSEHPLLKEYRTLLDAMAALSESAL